MIATGVLALFNAVTGFVIMTLLGLPLALPVAILSFFGGFIPYIGQFVTSLIGFLVAIAFGSTQDVVIMGIYTAVFNVVQGSVIAPLVYGRAVSLHPAIVLIVIPAGGELAGILGHVPGRAAGRHHRGRLAPHPGRHRRDPARRGRMPSSSRPRRRSRSEHQRHRTSRPEPWLRRRRSKWSRWWQRCQPGVLGPDPVTLDVRCFVVAGPSGIVLVDTGLPGSSRRDRGDARADRRRRGPTSLTSCSPTPIVDHVGGLADVAARAPRATVWAGARDVAAIPVGGDVVVDRLGEGDRIGGLLVLDTPGHTPGHISLVDAARVPASSSATSSAASRARCRSVHRAFTADAARSRASLARVAGMGVDRLCSPTDPKCRTQAPYRAARAKSASGVSPTGWRR